ncbi:hypothetical protein TNCV_4858311 [Trichonephila clavipes]|nr:hypothetical protein TNCV_4858311 [Trichonephila clavipes]
MLLLAYVEPLQYSSTSESVNRRTIYLLWRTCELLRQMSLTTIRLLRQVSLATIRLLRQVSLATIRLLRQVGLTTFWLLHQVGLMTLIALDAGRWRHITSESCAFTYFNQDHHCGGTYPENRARDL